MPRCPVETGASSHSDSEYVNREDAAIHTNTIERYFSVFKRGMRGIYQHCGKQHLHRYVAEFDFRYTHLAANGIDDAARAARRQSASKRRVPVCAS